MATAVRGARRPAPAPDTPPDTPPVATHDSATADLAALDALAESVKRHLKAGDKAAYSRLWYYRKAGTALAEAQAVCKRPGPYHRAFVRWLKDNCDLEKSQAYRYLKLAAKFPVTGKFTLEEMEAFWRRIQDNDRRRAAEGPAADAGQTRPSEPGPSAHHTKRVNIDLEQHLVMRFEEMVGWLAKEHGIDNRATVIFRAVVRWWEASTGLVPGEADGAEGAGAGEAGADE
jgi:hypothetical protein